MAICALMLTVKELRDHFASAVRIANLQVKLKPGKNFTLHADDGNVALFIQNFDPNEYTKEVIRHLLSQLFTLPTAGLCMLFQHPLYTISTFFVWSSCEKGPYYLRNWTLTPTLV